MAWRASVVIVETTDQIAVAVDEEVEITGFVVLEAETQASTAMDANIGVHLLVIERHCAAYHRGVDPGLGIPKFTPKYFSRLP